MSKERITKEEFKERVRKLFQEDPEFVAMIKKFEKKLGKEKYSDKLLR